jgi:diguanylate cyclase (GGDEF)-like protein/PAS domain S-box-containing protein
MNQSSPMNFQIPSQSGLFGADAETLNSLVAESMGLVILLWDLRNGSIQLSPHWAILIGEPAASISTTSRTFNALVHYDDRRSLAAAISSCRKRNGRFSKVEFRLQTSAGDWKWISARGKVIQRDATGHATQLMATFIDISECPRTSQVLEESEDHYRSIFNNTSYAIFLASPNGAILAANPSACKITDYSEDELKTMNCNQLFDIDDPRVAQLMAGLASGSASGEVPLLRKDHRAIEVELASAAFTNSAGVQKISMIMRDITSRKIAEHSLSRLASMYSARSQCNQAMIVSQSRAALFKSVCRIVVDCCGFSLAWIALVDPDTSKIYVGAADGAERSFLGKTKIATIDASVPEGRGPLGTAIREKRKYICNDYSLETTAEPWRKIGVEHGFKSGSAFPIFEDKQVIGALCLHAAEKDYFDPQLAVLLEEMAADISFGLANLQRAAALRISETRYRMLWETTTDAILALNADSIIQYANPAVLDVFGYQPEALVGKDLAVLQPERLRARHKKGMQRYLETGERRLNWRASMAIGVHSDGHEFPIELSFSDVQINDEREFIACIHDVSERKRSDDLIAGQNHILRMITGDSGLEETLAAINRLIEDQAPDTLCSILVLNDEGTQLERGAATSLPGDFLQLVCDQLIGPDSCGGGAAIHLKTPVLSTDIASDPSWLGYRKDALAHRLRACFTWPIFGRLGQVLGVLTIYHRKPGAPSELELGLIQVMTDLAGLAIDSRKSEDRIRYLAHYDELTGLPNRTMFSQTLSHALVGANRNSHQVGVLFMDLDRFKNINDTLGHESGDRMLREVAKRIRESVREVDTVARLGGDEFVVIIENFKDHSALVNVAKKLIDRLAMPMSIEGRDFHQTVSIGISTYPTDGHDAKTLIKNADMAMYRAKESGRHGYSFYSAQMGAGSLERITLESELRRAIEQNEFVLHYQPKVNIKTGEIVGVEALVRWQHPTKGLLSPLKFISLAEDTGQIVAIGQWVLRSACRQLCAWRDIGLLPIRIAVNLSARQFAHDDLLSDIAVALRESNLSPDMLELEITESMVMDNAGKAIRILNELKAMGVGISMDDFGTGYSSLANLKRFPLDSVKVDRSFIRDIPEDSNDAAITHAVIAMAHALKLKVIAEGVETEDQLIFLREHDCDEIQGYYFSRPLSANAFQHFFEQHYSSFHSVAYQLGV